MFEENKYVFKDKILVNKFTLSKTRSQNRELIGKSISLSSYNALAIKNPNNINIFSLSFCWSLFNTGAGKRELLVVLYHKSLLDVISLKQRE